MSCDFRSLALPDPDVQKLSLLGYAVTHSQVADISEGDSWIIR